MRGLFIGLGLVGGALLGSVVACDSDATASCSVGSLDCACTPGGGCDPGLECVGDVCIVVNTTETSGNATTESTTTGDPTAGVTTTPTSASGSTTAGVDSSSGGGLLLDVGDGETGVDPSSGCRAIDVLFALDSSGSMNEERAALAATNAFSQILVTLEGLNGGGIDYRVGLTTANDHGFMVPLGWLEPDPWFDSTVTELETMSLAFNGAAGQIDNLGDPPTGCEHALTSAVNLLVSDTTNFVRDDALLVLVLVTDVDDYGAYDQAGWCFEGIGCSTPPSDLAALRTLLVDTVKAGQEDGVAVITIAGDPASNDGVNFCNQPGSCGCNGPDCAVFHATRLYAFADMLGEQGITADLCGANVPMVVEQVLTDNVDQICQDFEPEG
ncbi:MAG: hypothetical protein ACE37F_33895 [Nannocystaceae bacterium]|nr:hypothetical protein [bacterium]